MSKSKSSRTKSNSGLITLEGDEKYGRVNLPAGNSQFRVFDIATGQEIIATVRGSLRRGPGKQKVTPTCLVLLQPDESSTKPKWFITYVYSDDEVKRLRRSGEIVDLKEKTNSNVVFVDDGAQAQDVNDDDENDKNDDDAIKKLIDDL